MCGRFTLREKLNQLLQLYSIHPDFNWIPRYNIAPTQPIVVLRQDDSAIKADLVKWGLIPSWSNDGKNPIVNARGDTVHQKPSFKESFQSRRCLIPADGFFEWWDDQRSKNPFFIHLQNDEPFVFAGLWDSWKGIETCTIITTSPNSILDKFHHRMPVILPPESARRWIDPKTKPEELFPLITPFPAEEMETIVVSTLANSTRIDSPDCLKPDNPKIQRGMW